MISNDFSLLLQIHDDETTLKICNNDDVNLAQAHQGQWTWLKQQRRAMIRHHSLEWNLWSYSSDASNRLELEKSWRFMAGGIWLGCSCFHSNTQASCSGRILRQNTWKQKRTLLYHHNKFEINGVVAGFAHSIELALHHSLSFTHSFMPSTSLTHKCEAQKTRLTPYHRGQLYSNNVWFKIFDFFFSLFLARLSHIPTEIH